MGPLLLTNALQVLSGTLVNLYVGQTLGTRALATMTAVFPVMLVVHSLLNGFGLGASVLSGQAWGAKDPAKLRQVAGTGAAGLMLFCVGMVALAVAAMPYLLVLLKVPTELRADAVLYGRLAALNALVVAPTILSMALLRSTGNTVIGFRGLVVFCVGVVIATPLCVHAFGVHGAAVGPGLAIAANLAWNLWDMSQSGHPLAWRHLTHHLHLKWPHLRQVLRIGIPGSLFGVTAALADMAVITLVNPHGPSATAAWGVVMQVNNWVHFPMTAIAIAASTFAAQAIGGGRPHEIDEITRVAMGMIAVIGGLVAGLFALAAPWFLGFFLVEPEPLAIAVTLLRISVWSSLLLALAMVLSATMRAAGTVMHPTAIYIACFALMLYPAALYLDRRLGIQGVWLAYALTHVVALALQAAYFFGIWRARPIVKLV